MSKGSWSHPTSEVVARHRAGGRRRYNAVRSLEKELRRREVLAMLEERGFYFGVQARMARALGVSEATISRDVAALLYDNHGCPTCGSIHSRYRWRERIRDGTATWTPEGVIAPIPS